jgi:hypothetical protein
MQPSTTECFGWNGRGDIMCVAEVCVMEVCVCV